MASVEVPIPLDSVFASVDSEVLSLEGKGDWEVEDSQRSLAAGLEAGYPQHLCFLEMGERTLA